MNNNKFCTMCGAQINSEDAFCESCGVKIDAKDGCATIPKPSKKATFSRKTFIITIIAITVVTAGSITAYSIFSPNYSIDNIIRDTLSLESAKVEISCVIESDNEYDYTNEIAVTFKKDNESEAALLETEDGDAYLSIKDGKAIAMADYTNEEYDFGNRLGIDSTKIERDIINYFADSFKEKVVPEGYFENIENSKKDGKIVITGDIENELDMFKWLYDSLDKDELKTVVLDNMKDDSEDKGQIEEYWDEIMDEIDAQFGYAVLDNIADCNNLDSSFEIILDKNGVVDQIKLSLIGDDIDWGNAGELVFTINISDKNEIDNIRQPSFE